MAQHIGSGPCAFQLGIGEQHSKFFAANAPEQVATRFAAISDRSGEIVPDMGAAQGMIELTKAQKAHGG